MRGLVYRCLYFFRCSGNWSTCIHWLMPFSFGVSSIFTENRTLSCLSKNPSSFNASQFLLLSLVRGDAEQGTTQLDAVEEGKSIQRDTALSLVSAERDCLIKLSGYATWNEYTLTRGANQLSPYKINLHIRSKTNTLTTSVKLTTSSSSSALH